MAYNKTIWQDLPNETTPIDAEHLNKIENELEALDIGKADKTGDTLTGELNFNNKNDYGAIRKIRTINGTDYGVAVGVGLNGSARMEYYTGSNTLSSIEARADGKLYNGVSGKKLAEQENSRVNITANTGTLAANTSYKIGNVVGINAKFTGVSISSGKATVLCTLPTGYYNTSTEMQIISSINNGTNMSSWIRANGQVVVMPSSNLNNAEIKLITSFIV